MTERTIEDVLADDALVVAVGMERLRNGTADGPKFSRDGSLAVIRTDPELADELLDGCPTHRCGACPPCRAAALLAAPAPADPERQPEED